MKNITIKFLLIIILFFITKVSFSVSLTISNAGIEEINGEYVQVGYYFNYPIFSNGSATLYFTYDWGCQSKWIFFYQGNAVYKNYDCSFLPPTENWEITCFGGVEPVPIVGEIENYLEFSRFSFHENASNNGTIAQNPIYVSLESNIGIKFTGEVGDDLFQSNKAGFTNLPEGLTPQFILTTDSTLQILLAGAATQNNNSYYNLKIFFNNSAFTNNDTSVILGKDIDFFYISFFASINESINKNFTVSYFKEELNLHNINSFSNIEKIKIITLTGQTIYTDKINTNKINIKLETGIYICTIYSKNQKFSVKFVVNN